MDLIVTTEQDTPVHQGWLTAGRMRWPCALGRSGITRSKREGDGATPAGRWPLRRLWVRQDRIGTFTTGLPWDPLDPGQGWCDAPRDRWYNRAVRLPYPASAEALWRKDGLYDLVVVVGYNDDPVIPGAGSAIFLHVAGDGYTPTGGCIALARASLLTLLPYLDAHSRMVIHDPPGRQAGDRK